MTEALLKKEHISSISSLPTLPEVATKLLQMVNDPETSASQVANLISKDVGITSKVLRMANSAFYGIPRTITTVQNAVVLLGMKVVNSLVLSVSVGMAFPNKKNNGGINRKAFWKHSLACATVSKLLAQKTRHLKLIDPEECFCAGLLHDIGRLVLDQYFNVNFIKALQTARENSIPLQQAEQLIFGCSHTNVGDWLTSKWELPRDLRLAIIHHHSPTETSISEENMLIIHLADFLSHKLGYDSYKDEVAMPLDADALAKLSLSQDELDKLEKTIPEEIEKLEASLSFEQVS